MSVILTLNAGSSSIKFALFSNGAEPVKEAGGKVDAIGKNARLIIRHPIGEKREVPLGPKDHAGAVAAIREVLPALLAGREVAGVGHRVVQGGPDNDRPRVLDDALIEELAEYRILAPLHQPHNIAAIRAAQQAFPQALQVATFDTAFHRGHPKVHDIFALPRRYYEKRVHRYGYHGLSYDYIAGVLKRDWPEIANGKVIIAHLGNGASLCGMDKGRSVSSSMGFSALDGLCMGTRVGQIDPGVLLYLMEEEGMGAAELTQLLYKESGLLGISGISHDMRTLLASDAPEAAEAIEYYSVRLGRFIGAMAAVIGGLDAMVFTAGVGENAAPVRARALDNLGFLGLEVNPEANAANATRIDNGRVPILVLPTDEEIVIARATKAFLAL